MTMIESTPPRLTAYEASLLAILEARPGQLVTNATLRCALYGSDTPPSSNVLQVLVSRLRRKGYPNIRAARGMGYRLLIPQVVA